MLIGIAAIVLFNVVDTFWVGQLGAAELAAMSFTFPVVMVVFSVSMGIGIGATAVIARALGHGDEDQVRRLTTDALLLANVAVTAVAIGGLLTMDPLFRALGADEATLVLIRQYMVPWYLGVGFLVIPMVGNSAIRATGDTKTPSYVMLVTGLVNAVLDPFLIFGWGHLTQRVGQAVAALGAGRDSLDGADRAPGVGGFDDRRRSRDLRGRRGRQHYDRVHRALRRPTTDFPRGEVARAG